jgi:Domain of unknown function (DUF4282)
MSTPVPPSGDEVAAGNAAPASESTQNTAAPSDPPVAPAASASAVPSGAPRSVTEAFADRLDDEGFFSALFDVTFTRFVTRKLAGPVYVVGLTLIGLGVVFGLISSLSDAIATRSFWGVLLFLFGLLLTVVGAMLAILLLRVGIEVFVAVVAIAENTRPRHRPDDE